MDIKKVKMAAAGALLASLVSFGGSPAFATDTTVVVTPTNMQGWAFAQETPIGSGALVSGPENPPLGYGSANLIVDSTGGEIIGKAAYQGTRLDDITRLEYSTYRTSGSPALAIALQFNIDSDVTDANNAFQGRLVYEPYYTHSVSTGEWQTWNPMDNAMVGIVGNWWFSNPVLAGSSGCSIAKPCTWSQVLAAFPNAGIHNTFGAVILKAGGGWVGGFNGNVDALTIGVNVDNTTYDFEPYQVATTKEQCMDGGWQTVTRADGSSFNNQGDCIQYVNTGR